MKKSIFSMAVALAMACFSLSALAFDATDHGPQFKADKTYSVAATPIAAVKESLPAATNDLLAVINTGMIQREVKHGASLVRPIVALSVRISGASSTIEHWRNRETEQVQRST